MISIPLVSSSVGVFRGGELGLVNVSDFSGICIHDGAAFGGSEPTGVADDSLFAGRQSTLRCIVDEFVAFKRFTQSGHAFCVSVN